MFLPSHLWVRVLFDPGASHSFISASCVRELAWTRVSVDMICQDCELEISGILLTMDLRVMLDFDVILGMD